MKYQELLDSVRSGTIDGQKLYKKRQNLIKQIEKKTGRPLIVYSTKLDAPREASNQIVSDDIIGFSDLTTGLTENNLDVLIESPGGDLAAAQRIVEVLRNKFQHIRFFIPGSAFSAATMIALSGDEILMDERGALGPIDPQINGIPARSILNAFDAVKEKLKEDGPKAIPIYLPLIQKYDLHIFEICKDVEVRGKQVVEDWPKKYMFKGHADEKTIAGIVSFFSDYDTHKSHSRPIFFREVQKLGLKVALFEDDIRDLVWDFFLCLKVMHELTPFIKIFENGRGTHWGKQHI